jgi:hypothetical protein
MGVCPSTPLLQKLQKPIRNSGVPRELWKHSRNSQKAKLEHATDGRKNRLLQKLQKVLNQLPVAEINTGRYARTLRFAQGAGAADSG